MSVAEDNFATPDGLVSQVKSTESENPRNHHVVDNGETTQSNDFQPSTDFSDWLDMVEGRKYYYEIVNF